MDYRIDVPTTGRPDDRDNNNLQKLQCDLLEWAEEQFGERDGCWTILRPDFDECTPYDERTPHIFYRKPFEQKLVQIKLVRRAHNDWPTALYQMAHEVIHLLNPKEKDLVTGCRETANVLEEGVATAFSFYVLLRCDISVSKFKSCIHPPYERAHKLLRRLPGGDIAAAKRIRRELPTGTSFSSVTSEDLKRIFPDVDPKHADELISKFCRNKTEFP